MLLSINLSTASGLSVPLGRCLRLRVRQEATTESFVAKVSEFELFRKWSRYYAPRGYDRRQHTQLHRRQHKGQNCQSGELQGRTGKIQILVSAEFIKVSLWSQFNCFIYLFLSPVTTQRMESPCSKQENWRTARPSWSRDRTRTQELMAAGIASSTQPMSSDTIPKQSWTSTCQSK